MRSRISDSPRFSDSLFPIHTTNVMSFGHHISSCLIVLNFASW
jgi:hypothetical protein